MPGGRHSGSRHPEEEEESPDSPTQQFRAMCKAEVAELRQDLGLETCDSRYIHDRTRANVVDELAVEAQSGIYLLTPEVTEPASCRLEAELKALEDQAAQQAEARKCNDIGSGLLGAPPKSIPRRLRAKEKWQPLPTSPEVKAYRRRLYEQTLQECRLHLEDDGNGGERICVTRSPRQKRTKQQQAETLDRLMNPPSKYLLPKSRSCGFVGKMQETLSQARGASSVVDEDAPEEARSSRLSTGPGTAEVWPAASVKAGHCSWHGKRPTRPSSAATASTEAPTLVDDVSDIYSLPSRPGSAPRSRPQSAGPRRPQSAGSRPQSAGPKPQGARPFSAGSRPTSEPDSASMTGSKQRERPASAGGALNVPSGPQQKREDNKVTEATWLRPPGTIEGSSAPPWCGRVLLFLGAINQETSEHDEMEVKPPSPSVCGSDDAELSELEELDVPEPRHSAEPDIKADEMSLRQTLQDAQAGKAPVHVSQQIASTEYHVKAAELSPRARAEILAAALSGRVPVRTRTPEVTPGAASNANAESSETEQRRSSTKQGRRSTSEFYADDESMRRASASKSPAKVTLRKSPASQSSSRQTRSHGSKMQGESQGRSQTDAKAPGLRAPPLAKSMPTLPSSTAVVQSPCGSSGRAERPWEWRRGKAERPFQEFREAQQEISSHEGSVGWQLRNGNPLSASRAKATSGAAWKPPVPGEKLWKAGKVWKTAPRPFNLDRQQHDLLKIYETSSALLQECELLH